MNNSFWDNVLCNFIGGFSSQLAWGILIFIITVVLDRYSPWKIWTRLKQQPKWYSYTRDSFGGIDWEWRWCGDDEICGLMAICPQCGNELLETNSNFDEKTGYTTLSKSNCSYMCDNCGYKKYYGELGELKGAVVRAIARKIRTGEYVSILSKG